MKCIFVIYGLVWVAAIGVFVFQVHWGWQVMVVAAAGSLWYLPVGTALGVIQLVLLFRLRK